MEINLKQISFKVLIIIWIQKDFFKFRIEIKIINIRNEICDITTVLFSFENIMLQFQLMLILKVFTNFILLYDKMKHIQIRLFISIHMYYHLINIKW